MEYNNRVFNKLVVLSFNKIKGITKGLYLNNPKSKYNRISINGNKNIVKVDNDSFLLLEIIKFILMEITIK